MFPNPNTRLGKSGLRLLWLWLALCCLSGPTKAEPAPLHRFIMGIYYPSLGGHVSRVDFQSAIEFWLNEFAPGLNIQPATARMFDRMENLSQAFDAGEVDFILAPPILLVQHVDRNKLANGFYGTSLSTDQYGAVILSRKDAQIKQLQQLKGKKLLLVKNDDLGATFLDTLSLKNLRQTYSKVFSHIDFKDKQSELILGLFFKQADVGVGDKEMLNVMSEMNPQIREAVEVIAEFPTKSINYGFFHRDYPDELRKKITTAVLNSNRLARPQQILHEMRMASLEPCPVEELKTFDQLIAEYRPLSKGKGK